MAHRSRVGEPAADVLEGPNRKRSRIGDLNDLDVFCRVVERASFSRAAADLGVPASSVSRRLARLEESLGVRLLQRTTRRLHLTEAGRAYYDEVSRALSDIESAEMALQVTQGSPRGRVRVTTVSEPFVEGLLYDFLERFPEVSLEIDKSHRTVDLVAEGFDVAIRAGSLPDSSLVAHRLLTSGPVVVGAPSYLERRGVPMSISDLRHHDCVVLGSSVAGATWTLHTARGEARVGVTGRVAVNAFQAAVEACCRGLGLGLFARYFIEARLASGELVQVLPEVAPSPTGLWVVYPSRTLVAPAVRALIEHIKFELPRRLGAAS
jgi:DNA-binding transcriptional LysR family regulator